MKITLVTDSGERLSMREPYPDAGHVVPSKDIDTPCPHCELPLQARCPVFTTGHDTMRGRAVCACGEGVGTLTVKVETIFGIEEDNRVLNGRCRVY